VNVEPTFAEEALESFLGHQGRFARSRNSAAEVRQSILRARDHLRARVDRRPAPPGPRAVAAE
jgi:hypothetical protein